MFKKINGILVGVNPFMNADTGGTGGSGTGDTTGTNADDPNNKGDNLDDKGDNPEDNTSTKTDKSNDDAQKAAIKAAEKAAQEKLLKSLGVSDVKTAKERLAALQEIEDQNKTEAQKAADKAKELEDTNSTLTNENTELKLQVAVLKADVKPEAIEDVIILAKNLVNEDTDFDKAVEKVLTKHTYFKKDAAQEEQQEGIKKPKFSGGEHKSKEKQTEQDIWDSSFNFFGKQ